MKDNFRIIENSNILDFPAEGRRRRAVNLPPPCPEGYEGVRPHCKWVGKPEFSGGYNNFDWKNIFKKGDDGTPTAPTLSGQAPAPFLPTPTGEAIKSSGGTKVSADTIESALDTATGLLQLLGSKRQLSEVEGVCGKQPKGFLRRKSVKQAWAQCASNYVASKTKPTSERKGLTTGTWVGIGIGSVVLISGIIFLATRKQKQIAVQP